MSEGAPARTGTPSGRLLMRLTSEGSVVPDCSGGLSGERPVARWLFNVEGQLVEWDWSSQPDPQALASVREIKRAKSKQGHVPRWAYSSTMAGHVRLESSLEHDLFRDLDRRAEIVRLVSQPLQLEWPGPRKHVDQHTPDLLSMDNSGAVTVWNVRPAAKQDEEFIADSDRTREACTEVGWGYEVFAGLTPVRRLNLMWLDGFRRPMPWYEPGLAAIREALPAGGTIGQLQQLDGGAGHILSAMWHAIWVGQIDVSLDAPLVDGTHVRVVPEEVPDR